jgi:hypothetical protein
MKARRRILISRSRFIDSLSKLGLYEVEALPNFFAAR